jgi:peptide/nickel transport system ATP-binding protein
MRRTEAGCPFADRCPWHIGPVCDNDTPPMRRLEAGNEVLCHYDEERLAALRREGEAPVEQR